jgi:hypothetical protein
MLRIRPLLFTRAIRFQPIVAISTQTRCFATARHSDQ